MVYTSPPTTFERLPFELLWHIFSFASPRERCVARQVSRQLRALCSHPIFWETIDLTHKSLWQLDELQNILTPHLEHIRSIFIQGVRDDSIRYLLNYCPNLEELSVRRWKTLSDHALKCKEHKKLRIFALHGDGTPYTAIDANSLSRLVLRLPSLQNLSLIAHAHIHIPTLLKTIKKNPPQQLQSITLPIYHHDQQYDGMAVSSDYAEQLLRTCPQLEQIFFVPNIGMGFNNIDTNNNKLRPLLVHHRRIIVQ
ncbi:hypothetical protein INT45_010077 [Circinella minor]|uniref:F-box domain-containing protein n=1 Tax=Circinella minor TaxID=1195481 RepID=A0A8H7VJS8_9FUNG|nr:hypothetical protein INT45_010077 [Circinella minor]